MCINIYILALQVKKNTHQNVLFEKMLPFATFRFIVKSEKKRSGEHIPLTNGTILKNGRFCHSFFMLFEQEEEWLTLRTWRKPNRNR